MMKRYAETFQPPLKTYHGTTGRPNEDLDEYDYSSETHNIEYGKLIFFAQLSSITFNFTNFMHIGQSLYHIKSTGKNLLELMNRQRKI